jgi:hypothetical protein
MRHALATVELAILLSRPSFLISRCPKIGLGAVGSHGSPELGVGLIEGLRRAAGAFALTPQADDIGS